MNLLRFPARLWSRLGVTAKLGLAFAMLAALICNATVVYYYTLGVYEKAEADIVASMDIRQRVFAMDGGLEKARRLYRDFIINYPEIGYDQARNMYCQPLLTVMEQVIGQSEELCGLIKTCNVSPALRSYDADVNLYLSAAKRFSAIFMELVELTTAQAEPGTGLFAGLEATMAEIVDICEPSENVALLARKMDLLAKEYRLSRQRPLMQAAFNTAFEINHAAARSQKFDARLKTRLAALLDQYRGVAEKILDIDVSIRGKINDFALQAAAVDPISSKLKLQAAAEVEDARARIAAAGRVAAASVLAGGLFGLSCALAVAWLVNASVTRKIKTMTVAACSLRDGNLAVRVEAGDGSELGLLAESFNAMAGRVQDLVENLEANVRERTLELAEKNKELDAKNNALEILSMTDRLTGLANRRKIDQLIQAEHLRAKRYRTPYALILIDVDRFKTVNDTYGHAAGDAVLVRFAGILAAMIRETDTAARYGGEEFVVLCPESGLDVAFALAERLRKEIADTDFSPLNRLTASFGVASHMPGEDAAELMARADASLYKAKQSGRNRVETVQLLVWPESPGPQG